MTTAETMHRRQCQMQRKARLKALAHLRVQEMNQVSDTGVSAQLPRIRTREELHWHEAPHDAFALAGLDHVPPAVDVTDRPSVLSHERNASNEAVAVRQIGEDFVRQEQHWNTHRHGGAREYGPRDPH